MKIAYLTQEFDVEPTRTVRVSCRMRSSAKGLQEMQNLVGHAGPILSCDLETCMLVDGDMSRVIVCRDGMCRRSS